MARDIVDVKIESSSTIWVNNLEVQLLMEEKEWKKVVVVMGEQKRLVEILDEKESDEEIVEILLFYQTKF